MSVKVIDKGWNRIKKLFPAIVDASVKVGVLSGEGENDGVSVAFYGAVNHYGNGKIPARPFMDAPSTTGRNELNTLRPKLLKAMTEGSMSLEQGLNALGLKGQSTIQRKIQQTTSPGNAQSTIDKKGSSHPLIADGRLLGAISYEVNQ